MSFNPKFSDNSEITLKDIFAGFAMMACIARWDDTRQVNIIDLSKTAYLFADAMLNERKERASR